MNLTDFGIGATATIPGGVTITGMTAVNIASLEAVAVDFSSWQALATIDVKASVGDDAIVAGNQMTVDVTDTAGNVSVQGGATISVTTDNAHSVSVTSAATGLQVNLGDSTNTVVDTAANAAVAMTLGGGANTVTLGQDASGIITFVAHSAGDAVVLGPTNANAILIVSGLNNAGSDTITFSGDANTLTGFTQVTAADVTASSGNPDNLGQWIVAADGLTGAVGGAAHSVMWFVFQGNTYLLESVAGPSSDKGSMPAGNTLVELTGTGYIFAHATGANGTLHLVG